MDDTMASATVEDLVKNVSEVSIPYGILEALLFFAVLWIVFKTAYDPRGSPLVDVHDLKVQMMINNWTPEPLVKEVAPNHPALHPRLVTGKVGKFIDINGESLLNLGSHNYLGFLGSKKIEERAIKTVRKYGVGSCGPRGFYGTVDVHLDLEGQLASYLGMEEAAVYSYGFSTAASVIPAYAKRADIIFVDKEVNFAIQKGLNASRSTIVTFDHNDMDHLATLLKEQDILDKKNPKKASATRRFLVVEGIYMNTGTICSLPELMRLKEEYKLRIFIDESISFGTLGAHGRGVTEHFGVPVVDVDLIMASLEWAVASIGGFSVGSSYIVEHQRLSALGYCFSASLPPLLTTAATTALDMMKQDPSMFARLKTCCIKVHDALATIPLMLLRGDPESPIKHLTISNELSDWKQQELLLVDIVNYCFERNVALQQSRYLAAERYPLQPSLRIAVNNMLDDEDIHKLTSVLQDAAKKYLESIIIKPIKQL